VGEEQKGLKDRELQKHYEDLLALFGTPEWAVFTEDLARIFATANTLDGIVTQTDLDFRRGQIDILRKIMAQPDVTKAAYEMLLEDEGRE
jgi:hypothetical protein